MRRIITALFVVAVLSPLAAQAAGPRRPIFAGRAATPHYSAPPHYNAAPYNKHAAIAAYGKAVYPKYYGGLHSREFQNLGVPHGDIGLRGNDLTLGPW